MAVVSPDAVRKILAGEAMASYLLAYGTADEQDQAMASLIDVAQTEAENYLMMCFEPTVIKCYPDDDLTQGVDYDREERPYDFHAEQWNHWGFMQVRWAPIISVERVRLTFGEEWDIAELPSEWIRVYEEQGAFCIVPTPGSGWAVLLQTGGVVSFFLTHLQTFGNVPGVFAVDYTAGVTDISSDRLYSPLLRAVTLNAAAEVLLDIAESKHAGVGSVSLSGDGLSESRQLTKFQDRVQTLRTRGQEILDRWRDSHSAMLMVSA